MTTNFALPFLTLPDEAVTLAHWMIGRVGEPLAPMGPVLDNWDYAADVEVRTSIRIDISDAAKMLAIPEEELKLAVILKIGTGRGRFPRVMERVSTIPLDLHAAQPLDLAALVPGGKLSGRVYLRLDVVLAAPSLTQDSPLSPSRVGSRLWSREFSVELEDGGENRFPIEVVSFVKVFPGHPHVAAPWYLSWRPGGLAADFVGAVRLYVNSDHQGLAERVVDGDRLTLEAILGDVMVQMVGAVLDAEDLGDQLGDCEDGSVGAQISGWMELAFPGRSLEEVRGLRRSQPGNFHACLHAAADLGDME
uniref:hypothetical protein n=1 Tax=Paenirhodobacter enshiensis TaxID=1105367 RepID=UPI0035B0F331